MRCIMPDMVIGASSSMNMRPSRKKKDIKPKSKKVGKPKKGKKNKRNK